MKETVLELTWLDIIGLAITIVSIVVNIIQYIDARNQKKNFRQPFFNSLIGLFNQIKSTQNSVYMTQQLLWNQVNPHEDIETIRWEYNQFTQSMLSNLDGLKEEVVAVLITVDPSDREGRQSFRASDYGLTDNEKELREINTQKYLAQYEQQSTSMPQANEEAASANE